MNTQLLLNTIQRGTAVLIPKISEYAFGQCSIINRNFHIITKNVVTPSKIISSGEINNIVTTKFLQPTQYLLNQICGMKLRGNLHRRCKNCYFICSCGRWYVRCKTHPRHKQAQIVKKEKNTWVLTSVCQSKKRPWY